MPRYVVLPGWDTHWRSGEHYGCDRLEIREGDTGELKANANNTSYRDCIAIRNANGNQRIPIRFLREVIDVPMQAKRLLAMDYALRHLRRLYRSGSSYGCDNYSEVVNYLSETWFHDREASRTFVLEIEDLICKAVE